MVYGDANTTYLCSISQESTLSYCKSLTTCHNYGWHQKIFNFNMSDVFQLVNELWPLLEDGYALQIWTFKFSLGCVLILCTWARYIWESFFFWWKCWTSMIKKEMSTIVDSKCYWLQWWDRSPECIRMRPRAICKVNHIHMMLWE